MLDEATVRELCEMVSQEKDPQKAAELLSSLCALIELESDEIHLRIRQMLLHYRRLSTANTEPPSFVSTLLVRLFGNKLPPAQQ